VRVSFVNDRYGPWCEICGVRPDWQLRGAKPTCTDSAFHDKCIMDRNRNADPFSFPRLEPEAQAGLQVILWINSI